MKIKLAFFDWDTIYGKLIKLGTGCKWTHVGIVGEVTEDSYIIYEAINKGLVKNNYSLEDINKLALKNKILIKEIEVPDTLGSNMLKQVCDMYLGRPYDWLSIFNIFTYIIFRKYALNINGPRYLICSEFVARVLYDLGLNLSEILNKPYDYITPYDIYNYFVMEIGNLVKKSSIDDILKNGNNVN